MSRHELNTSWYSVPSFQAHFGFNSSSKRFTWLQANLMKAPNCGWLNEERASQKFWMWTSSSVRPACSWAIHSNIWQLKSHSSVCHHFTFLAHGHHLSCLVHCNHHLTCLVHCNHHQSCLVHRNHHQSCLVHCVALKEGNVHFCVTTHNKLQLGHE